MQTLFLGLARTAETGTYQRKLARKGQNKSNDSRLKRLHVKGPEEGSNQGCRSPTVHVLAVRCQGGMLADAATTREVANRNGGWRKRHFSATAEAFLSPTIMQGFLHRQCTISRALWPSSFNDLVYSSASSHLWLSLIAFLRCQAFRPRFAAGAKSVDTS